MKTPFTLLLLLFTAYPAPLLANTGYIDLNLYPYTHVSSDTAVTVNILSNLPQGFQYYSLNSFRRRKSAATFDRFNLDSIISEQNLRWSLPGNTPWNLFQLTAQALLRDESNNDALRLGFRWKVHKTPFLSDYFERTHLRYWVNFHGAQFDETPGYQWQISHNFRIDPFPEIAPRRFYLKGWVDHNIDHENGVDHTWVEELQLGIRVIDEFHLIAEQRYNEFRRTQESSFALGVEYILRF